MMAVLVWMAPRVYIARRIPPAIGDRDGATVTVLMFAHLCGSLCGGTTTIYSGQCRTEPTRYFAFVNYTTLGYGDIVRQRAGGCSVR